MEGTRKGAEETAMLSRMINSISDRLKKLRAHPRKSPRADIRVVTETKSRSQLSNTRGI